MTRLSEKRDVQDALVNYLIGIGWECLPPDCCPPYLAAMESRPTTVSKAGGCFLTPPKRWRDGEGDYLPW